MRARNVLFACLSLSLLATVAVEGCGGSSSKALGTLGQACYADNRCNADLTCVGSVCVTPGPGGTAPHDAGADAKDGGKDGVAGAGGTSGAGGDAAAGADGGDASTADGGDAAAGHDGATEASPTDGGDAGVDTSSTETGTDGAPATEGGAGGADGSADSGDA